jgi:hypothetical protein
MRRILCAAVFLAVSVGFLAIPAGADLSTPPGTTLSFDYSDNVNPASASNGEFNIIVDVIPAHTSGVVRIVAVAPIAADEPNLVCAYQTISYSQVECAFNFTSSGVWIIHAFYATSSKDVVSQSAVASLRVGP